MRQEPIFRDRFHAQPASTFRRAWVSRGRGRAVIKLLEKKLAQLGNPLPTFGKVVICSGHMIDKPERVKARFPASKEAAVRERIWGLLATWSVGKGDLAISSGACGSGILFAEECQRRGASVRLMLALPRADLVSKSVAFAGESTGCSDFINSPTLAKWLTRPADSANQPADLDVFSRCNLWMLNTARVEVGPADHLFSVLVWDEQADRRWAGRHVRLCHPRPRLGWRRGNHQSYETPGAGLKG